MGVFVILGTALVGLMAAAVDAWRQGEAGRVVNERMQALQRQIADDLAAAILDPPPPPDFHFALDSLYDLSDQEGDPNAILDKALSDIKEPTFDETPGRRVSAFSGPGSVVLRIRVPFIVGAALLQARLDVLDADSEAVLEVTRNEPNPADPEAPGYDAAAPIATWFRMDALQKREGAITAEAIGGGETDASEAVQGGDIVFVKATLTGRNAHFLRSDRMRPGARPVLVLDCYRNPDAIPQAPRPTFAAWFRGGAQTITFTRTLPPELEATAAAEGNSATGRAQVIYRFLPYHVSLGKPGLGVIRRAFAAPIPRTQSADLEEGELSLPNIITLVRDEERLKSGGVDEQTFVASALHLGMSFWGAETTTWEDRPDLDPAYDAANPPRPPGADWLSSRYLPEQVQVTLVLEPDRGKRAGTALAQAIAADFPGDNAEARLGVASTQAFDAVQRPSETFVRDPRHFIKVGDEWLFYSRIGSPSEFVIPGISARGTRGTRPAAHAMGADVYRGIVSVFSVRIPAYHHWER